jgi:hypothetical protein
MNPQKKIEMYYERLLKLANSLQTLTTDNFFIIVFRSRLQFYLRISIVGMKQEILQQCKELVPICEEGIYVLEALSTLSVPQTTGIRSLVT